jgi:4a-hydroxytetrahydrobiopterin dehydratase
MTENLSQFSCVLVRGNTPPLQKEEINLLLNSIPDWEVIRENKVGQLQRKFIFKDFKTALSFTNAIGEISELEDHHPSILTEWGSVTVTWWTHSIKGLHKNDFIMASKADEIYTERKRT